MSGVKLTKGMRSALEMADRGGVFCLTVDRQYPTLARLMALCLITSKRDKHGYYNITPAGRNALKDRKP